MKPLPNRSYTITWIDGENGIDPDDDNVDVIVDFEGRERFTATFFTLTNLLTLFNRYGETGECSGGLYVWSSHMIVVQKLTFQNVESAVAGLLASGEFATAFQGPFTG